MHTTRNIARWMALSTSLLLLAESGQTTASATDERPPNESALDSSLPEDPAGYRADKARAAHAEAGGPVELDRGPASAPEGSADGAAHPAATGMGTTFAGINRTQNGGDPPDTIVGASDGTILEAVNFNIRLTTVFGDQLDSQSLATFFSSVFTSGAGVFDPKVYFDRNSTRPRYYVVALQKAGDGNTTQSDDVSRLLLAVSRRAEPSTLGGADWCWYNYNTINDAGTPEASWADYPGLGAGADALVVTANHFEFKLTCDAQGMNCVNAGRHVRVRAWNKNVLNNNAASCPSLGGIPFFSFKQAGPSTIQPAQHYTSPSSFTGITNPVYLVDAPGSTDYRVWRLSNVASGSPSFVALATLNGNYNYGVPPQAPGGAGTSSTGVKTTGMIDTGDIRITQVAGRFNTLWAVHATSCNFTSGTPAEACYRYVRIISDASGPRIAESHTIGRGNGTYSFWPSIAASPIGDVGISFQSVEAATSNRLSARAAVHELNETNFDSDPLATGNCAIAVSYDAGSRRAYRSGDYTGAQTWSDDTFWVAAERALLINNVCQWSTQVAHIFFDVGTFTYSPKNLVVEPGELRTLRFSWTHPTGWRKLRTLDLRIGGAVNPVLWVRFNEAKNTFSVYNAANGKFGPGFAPGSDVVLHTPRAALHLSNTQVIGPPGQKVKLKLRVAFKEPAAGATYPVSVRAVDDRGHVQGFDPAGTVRVV